MSHYLIVGKNFGNLRDLILNRGDEYTLLRDVLTIKDPSIKYKREVRVDFSTKEKILNALEVLPTPVDGVIATYENYVLPAAWICEAMNLPGLPVAAAEACTDKFLMRTLFSKAPEKISPDFAIVATTKDVERFAAAHTFPLILKPANLAKSLLVTKSSSLQELLSSYEGTTTQIEKVYKQYAPHRQPKLIIEEFMTGSIHSVDAFVDTQGIPHIMGQIVDYQTGYDIGFKDNFHYSRLLPSKLSSEDQVALLHTADLGIRSLGMNNSPAHVEIIMTPNGPQIVEIGARNGGYRERMHSMANGIDIIGASLRLSTGELPDIKAIRNDPCAVLELFPKIPGIYQGIENETLLRGLSSLKYLSIKAHVNSYRGKASDGFKMCAVIILHNSDRVQFQKDLDFVNSSVRVMTTPA